MSNSTPISAEKMREVAKGIQQQLPGKGFALLVFDVNSDDYVTQYISNGEREDMIIALEEVLARWKFNKNVQTPEPN